MIDLDHVTAGYDPDHPVIEDLTDRVPPRGVTRVRGGNGAGKSTLVEVLSGYLPPNQGQVTVGGHAADSAAARRIRRVVRTQPALLPFLTVRDHVALFATAYAIPLEPQLSRAAELGLTPWFDEQAGALSSGTAKKLWYLMCTGGQPDVVVLDEPFNAIDAEGTAVIVRELAEWALQRAVILVAHTLPHDLQVDHEITLGRTS